MTTESKHERFRRLAQSRGDRLIREVALLANLANTKNYSYSADDVEALDADFTDAPHPADESLDDGMQEFDEADDLRQPTDAMGFDDITTLDIDNLAIAADQAVAKAQQYTAAAPAAELADLVGSYFTGLSKAELVSAIERYQQLQLWKKSPMVEKQAMDQLQDMLVQGGVLEAGKKVDYARFVDMGLVQNLAQK